MNENDEKLNNPIILRYIDILESCGAKLINKVYDPVNFGNILVDYSINSIRFRLILDRSKWSVTITKLVDSYMEYDIEVIRALIEDEALDDLNNWSIEDKLIFLEKHINDILFLYSPDQIDNTLIQLKDISMKYLRRLLPTLYK